MIKSHDVGIGLRPAYYNDLIDGKAPVDWLEIVSEDYFPKGGLEVAALERIRAHYPVVMHGVGLSLGSADPLNWNYLHALKRLEERLQPAWVSDHICWTGIDGWVSHDLLPLPRTQKVLDHLIARVHVVQEFLGRPLVLENVTQYLDYKHNDFSEGVFLSLLSEATGCSFLLDINNSYVNGINRSLDPWESLSDFPWKAVRQYHVAGHEVSDSGLLLDTHRSPLSESVCDLMVKAWHQQPAAILLERDDHMPDLAILWQEALSLKKRLNSKETDEHKRSATSVEGVTV